MKDIKLR